MDKAVKDWLIQQYVWTVQNDGSRHFDLKNAADAGNFGKFRRMCGSAIACINGALEERPYGMFSEEHRVFVVMELWVHHGGKQAHSDPGFVYCLNLARREGLSYPSGAEAPEQTIFQQLTMAKVAEPEVNIMTKIFESKQFVGGVETVQLTDAQLITVIKNTEDKIAELKKIKTASKKIAANIEQMEADLASVVAVLDAR